MDNESEEQREKRIRSLWNKLDVRKEGSLDVDALKLGLRKLDHPLQNADDLVSDVLKAADINHDGRVQFEEFHRFVTQTESQIRGLFVNIDRDRNGNVDKEELRAAFSRAGLAVEESRLERFFNDVDANNDGVISFAEWRDFLLFIPPRSVGLKAVLSYYQSTVKVNPEGDVHLSDETIQGAGTATSFFHTHLFGAILQITSPSTSHHYHRPRMADVDPSPALHVLDQADQDQAQSQEELADTIVMSQQEEEAHHPVLLQKQHVEPLRLISSVLISCVPHPGYFLAGGLSGVASRTTTAPLDRLKVYLIAQTDSASEAIHQAKKGAPVQATKQSAHTLIRACRELWAAGGIRSLFAGNGLNIIKVMPESAVKFGSYEATKRVISKIEGHGDSKRISSSSQFIAGGIAGMISQAVVYPLDTLKFRMQNETVRGGLSGNALIVATAKKMWARDGMRSFYRGLTMGLVGMFPYAAIDLGTFEYLKRTIVSRKAARLGVSHEEAMPGNFTLALMGGFSGAFGASAVYPINLLRTRLQSQGTAAHPRTYTGIVDVTRQTISGEGFRGLFKGLTPNLLKVIPAVSITYVVYENTKKALKLR
ncbi:calcium dependent mitochondrial carrier protein [Myriangium duriaei CBS 260.36]|uniref:Mitochondrial thiamine pyrophosphate carrier 1 n=1 Tax=Myriangium duriaei CBS 260.36 TaxID=1168546 RepID=A0A9P4J4U8_9PEZI|nr:calcium dependent mitochondrial carrier protein [Myriangium duriaei CBS 260.36]